MTKRFVLGLCCLILVGCLRPGMEESDLLLAKAGRKLEQGDLEGARDLFLKVASKYPNRRDSAITNLGIIAARQGELERAERSFREAVERYPNSLPPALNLAYLLYSQRRYHESLDLLKKLVAAQESLSEAYNLLGLNSLALGDSKGAEGAFKKALEVNPENHRSLNNLAYLSLEEGIWENDPLGLITRALALRPDEAAYLDTLGFYYFQMGMFDDAQKIFNRVVQTGPFLHEARGHYAHLLEWMGYPGQAAREWETVRSRADRAEDRLMAEKHLWDLRTR